MEGGIGVALVTGSHAYHGLTLLSECRESLRCLVGAVQRASVVAKREVDHARLALLDCLILNALDRCEHECIGKGACGACQIDVGIGSCAGEIGHISTGCADAAAGSDAGDMGAVSGVVLVAGPYGYTLRSVKRILLAA